MTIIPPHDRTPQVNAPQTARRAASEPPVHNVEGNENFLESWGGRLPDLIREPLFWVTSKVNNVIFKSDPPGRPVPRADDSWTFAAIGDYGSGSRAQTKVAETIVDSNPELVVTLGDNIYWTGKESNWRKKWDPDKYFGKIRKTFPVLPSLGNHDIAGPGAESYFKRFPELKGARYYSFENKNVHFTVLDSNESLQPGSTQHKWLNRDLSNAADEAWKVVYFHHPMYSGYTARDNVVKDALGPTLAKHGVSLVMTGHDHSFERTKAVNDNGMVHAMVGAGGHTLYPYLFPQPEWSGYRTPEYGHLNVEVTDDALVGRYILRNGKVRDTFTVPRPPALEQAEAAAKIVADNEAKRNAKPEPPAPAGPAPDAPQGPAPVATDFESMSLT